MAFRIDYREAETTGPWTNQWRFPERVHFMKSNAYDTLVRELRRYVLGEATGRSFLIAGHRGAGKTSLVRRAVEDLNRTLIEEAYAAAAQPIAGRQRMDRQRPVLVRLHGPSLLDPEKPAESASEPQKEGEPPQGPLVQVTIALYRALAAEYGRSFANHAAYDAATRQPGDLTEYHELAAQFTLELDNFPKPALLLDFYQRLGRTGIGVLWPVGTGDTLPADRGLREIIALATASQAFAVCTGKVKWSTTENEARKFEQSLETKGEATLKDAVNKLAALAAGVATGVASQGVLGIAGAAGLGLVVGLLSAMTLTWTSKRSRTREQKLDYSFIIQPDKQSLERDLPLVIERVREAGLTPIFVLDELDKVDEGEIAVLVKRLKHLTTDFGCFCFLTDRKYYDGLIQRVDKDAFPIEHSFFSHLLFILHHPDRCLPFLHDITRQDPPESAPTPGDEAARSIFGLFVLHRSKLNMVEVLREIAGQCRADGELRLTSNDLRRLEYVLAATIQLAIGQILKSGPMQQRVQDDPSFTQCAMDALYMLSRAWEAKRARVTLDRASIAQCLLLRMGKGDIDPELGEIEQALAETGFGSIDLDILEQQVGRLAALLCDCAQLKSEIAVTEGADLADLIPGTPLIRAVPGKDQEFEFVYDMYGQELTLGPASPADRVDAPLDILEAFEAALAVVGLEIADLISLQIIPATVDARELSDARQRLQQVRSGGTYERLTDDLSRVGAITAFLESGGAQLAAVLGLAIRVAADARTGSDPRSTILVGPALRAVARHVDLRGYFQQIGSSVLQRIDAVPSSNAGPVPRGSVQSIGAWGNDLQGRVAASSLLARADHGELSQRAWAQWPRRILDFLTGNSSAVEQAFYADIVCAAANLPPGNMFQRELGQLTVADWSTICVAGFPASRGPGLPGWTVLASLGALGFGPQVMSRAARFLPHEDTISYYQDIMRTAQRSTARTHLLIMRDTGSIALEPPKRPAEPVVLALSEGQVTAYTEALERLADCGAFDAVLYEVDDPAL